MNTRFTSNRRQAQLFKIINIGAVSAFVLGASISLMACEEKSTMRTETTTKSSTPEGTTKTTETHEKKVETSK